MSSWYHRMRPIRTVRGMARMEDTIIKLFVRRPASEGVQSVTQQRRPDTPRGAPGSGDPGSLAVVGPGSARSRAAGAASDCGPHPCVGTWGRLAPSGVGPLPPSSKSTRGAPSGSVGLNGGPVGYRWSVGAADHTRAAWLTLRAWRVSGRSAAADPSCAVERALPGPSGSPCGL